MTKTTPPIRENEIELFDAMTLMVDGFDTQARTEVLRVLMCVLACLDAKNGRIDQSKLTRLISTLSGGDFQFEMGTK